MSDLEMLDAISVREVYVNTAWFEDAGDGQMRIFRGTKHGSTVIPVISYVTPAAAMIRDAQAAIEFARTLLLEHFGASH